ncbi:MAG: flagellar basal body P-ring formation chaperone FlgA [Thalassolituus sp.]
MIKWISVGGERTSTEVVFPSLSSEYRLPDCNSAPEINVVRHLQPGRNGIEVSCSQPFWRQSVAVELQIYKNVVTVDGTILRDTVISADQLRLSRMDTTGLHQGFFDSIEDVAGTLSRRTLRQGTPVTPDMLDQPDLIERGQPLVIRLNRPGIKIEIKGEALSDGHLGEGIRVRNVQSGAIVFAEVIGDGLVQVR